MGRNQPRVTCPLRDVLRAFTGREPPAFVREHYDLSQFSDIERDLLHSWCVQHVKPDWATGIGLLEAAELMVHEAVSNGNIPPKPPGPPEIVQEMKQAVADTIERKCENCANRCMDMDMDPYCAAVNPPFGTTLIRGRVPECGDEAKLWELDRRPMTRIAVEMQDAANEEKAKQ